MTEDPQTYWKRIKVPAELADKGWKLIKRDTAAPFALVNKKLDLDTGGYPDPQEAIEAGRALAIESAEASAIAAEGSNGAPDETAASLPVHLIDEGWRLVCDREQHPAPYRAERGELQTRQWDRQSGAIREAIALETKRQAELEAKETGTGAVVQPNGHQEAPAEIKLELERIRTDGGTQQRLAFDEAVLADYCEAMRDGPEFPAVDVFFDGAEYWLADGFYRYRAHRDLGRPVINAHVRQGSQRDAILFSLGANARHGLRRTPEEKRRAVLVMLRDPEWATWSDAYLAERVNVSLPFVRKLRKQETKSGASAQPTTRRGRDGRVQETARIGTPATQETEDPQLPLENEPATAPTNKSENEPVAGFSTSNEGEKSATAGAVDSDEEDQENRRVCSQCGTGIGPGEYRDAERRCWDCSGKGKKKAPAAKLDHAPTEAEAAALGYRPAVEQFCKDRDLFVSFTWDQGKATIVSAGVRSGLLEVTKYVRVPSLLVWPFLPDKVIDLIQDQAAAPKPARKPASKKAPVKAARRKAMAPSRARATKKAPALSTPPAKTAGKKIARGTSKRRIPKLATAKPTRSKKDAGKRSGKSRPVKGGKSQRPGPGASKKRR